MKKVLFLFPIMILLLILSCSDESNMDSKDKVDSNSYANDKIPVTIQTLRTAEKVTLSLQPESGFGIQIEVPNRLSAMGESRLKIISENLKFIGKPKADKPDYYSNLEPMELLVEGSGILHLTGKIFYCDFSKNICLPGTIDRKIAID